MTDTIDVAALVEPLVVLSKFNIPPDTLELLVHGNPSRGIPPGALATALKSQADAIAEARRNSDIAFRAAIDSGEALENAQEELATMREALEKAELAARNLMPYLEWQLSAKSPGHHPTFGSAVAYFKGSFAPEVFAPGSSRFDEWQARRVLGGTDAK